MERTPGGERHGTGLLGQLGLNGLLLCVAVLVSFAVIMVPTIKRRLGEKIAITLSQSLAVAILIVLASTQYMYEYRSLALAIAIVCYVLRQPLMNMAGPMTSELSMNYVGPRNQEMMSALSASIWSGSWFVSAQIFSALLAAGLAYAEVFFITAALYAVGVILYHFLILDYQKRKQAASEITPAES